MVTAAMDEASDVKVQANLPSRSLWYYSLVRFMRNRLAVVAAVFVLVLVLSAIFVPMVWPVAYNTQAFLYQAYDFPSADHWFGIDPVGRDYFIRVIYATRVSLGIGMLATLVSLVIGVPIGAAAGYLGGLFDWFIMRIIEVMSVIPPLLIGLIVAAVTGGGVVNIIFIAAAFFWVPVARLVRGQVIALKNEDYVLASRALGAKTGHILRKHLIPNTMAQLLVGLVLTLPQAIMLEASLSYLGVGVHPPLPSWGQMISEGLAYIFFYWHLPLFPSIMLAVTILTVSVVGDGLRDALDPSLKGR